MARPNILECGNIFGNTAVLAITTSATSITANPAGSNKTYKINALYISNVDGTNAAEASVDIYRENTAYHIARTVVVPPDTTLDVISKSVYLLEGDSLRLTSNSISDLEAVCSFEELQL